MPRSRAVRVAKERTNSPAPTSSTIDRATCTPTSHPINPPRPAVTVRPRSWMASIGRAPATRNAGAIPNISVVRTATAVVNARTRPSIGRSRTTWVEGVDNWLTRNGAPTIATNMPSAAPDTDKAALSAKSCRTSRQRGAPSAAWTLSSCRRDSARARRRFATFTQPIRRTRTTTPPVISSGRWNASPQVREAGRRGQQRQRRGEMALEHFPLFPRRVSDRRGADLGLRAPEIDGRGLERLPWLQPRDDAQEVGRGGPECGVAAANQRLGAERHRDVEGAADLQPEEFAGRDADDREGHAIEAEGPAERRGCAAELTLRVAVADHRDRPVRTAAGTIVGGGKRAAGGGVTPSASKNPASTQSPSTNWVSPLSATLKRSKDHAVAPAKQLRALTDLLPEWIAPGAHADFTGVSPDAVGDVHQPAGVARPAAAAAADR